MFAIAVLFGLAVWVFITIIAILIGAKTAGVKGAFAGFMLTMGGFIVYWIVEYIYIQYTVTRLCETEGGITVYVTPEEWRKQIGEEEWEKSVYIGDLDENYPKGHQMQFNGKSYLRKAHISKRIDEYMLDNDNESYHGIIIYDKFFYDKKLKKILYHDRLFYAKRAPSLANTLAGLKFWLDYGVQGCSFENQTIYTDYISSKSK